MVRAWIDNSVKKLIIQTDDPTIKYLLEVTKRETKFIPWQKKWGTTTTTTKIYDHKVTHQGVQTFTLGLGWCCYVINVLKNNLLVDDYNNIVTNGVLAQNYRTYPFPELRDYQNDDVLHVLKYRRGLFSCYTGYGKTSVIATLTNYFYGQGKKVLIITPQKKPNDEIVKRCKKMFNLDIPSKDGMIKNMIVAGLTNRKDVKDPGQFKALEAEWASYEVVLVDEVEYTMSNSGIFLYNQLVGAELMYGFSGTADKSAGECISFINGLDDTVLRNKNLVSVFGPSVVFRMPLSMDIDYIKFKTMSLNQVKFKESDFDEKSNVYNNVMTRLWTDPQVCNSIINVVSRYPRIYIPMNNLINILDVWIERYFVGKFRILLICHEGYIYYDLSGERTNLKTLDVAWDYVNRGLVDVIPSTSSGFRALDLPGIDSILLITGKNAGTVLQSIGRAARGKHMNIIGFESTTDKKIPIFTRMQQERDEMVHTYYKYCNITDSTIYEQ